MQKNESGGNKGRKDVVRCPRCNSASVSLTTRGYSALFGYLGANTPYYKCNNCGHKWKAKKLKNA